MRYEELELAGCELETDLPEEEVIISFDSAQMNRVFENIINNSLRHNKGKMTIFSGLNVTDDAVIIRLGDDGIGIPAAIREHIFEPFVTGNEARTSGGGSGLGMAISKKIVEAHGGELVLMPGKEKGTTYEIRLPIGKKPVQIKSA
jgi:signal transduction histidine kinase